MPAYMHAQAVAVKKKEPSTEKPAAAAAAKPAAKKAAPDAKAPSEPKNKAAKATKENNGPKVKRAKSAYMFFCSDQRSSIKGTVNRNTFSCPLCHVRLCRLYRDQHQVPDHLVHMSTCLR